MCDLICDAIVTIVVIINILNLARIMLLITRTTGVQTVVMNGDINTRVL